MRTRLIVTGVVGMMMLGGLLWFATAIAANRAMAQEQRALVQAAQAQAEIQAQAAERAEQEAIRAAALAAKRLQDAKDAHAAADSTEANNAAAKRLLAERMEATFEQQPLDGVLEFLRDRLELEVHAQRGEIESAGLSLDAPVTLKFKSVRGDMLLELALRQVSPDLGYTIRDGIVIIGTRDAISGNQAVRVYNCRELLATAAKATPPAVPATPMGSGGGAPPAVAGAGPMSSGAMFGGSGMGGFFGELPATPALQLQRVIRTTVAPESWDANGGVGTMEEFGGLLVVNQSEEVHERVEKLLQMLREAAEKR